MHCSIAQRTSATRPSGEEHQCQRATNLIASPRAGIAPRRHKPSSWMTTAVCVRTRASMGIHDVHKGLFASHGCPEVCVRTRASMGIHESQRPVHVAWMPGVCVRTRASMASMSHKARVRHPVSVECDRNSKRPNLLCWRRMRRGPYRLRLVACYGLRQLAAGVHSDAKKAKGRRDRRWNRWGGRRRGAA